VLERFAGATLLAVTLETGRTHQIRVHMQSIGHPLVGDPTYGRRARGGDPLGRFPRQALHAARLGLVHPATGRECEWRAPVPADLGAALAALRR
jgi:23S rRNA pseudouridine1911/1915/1917 synthase